MTLGSGALAFGGRWVLLRVARDMNEMAGEEMASETPDVGLATRLTALGCLATISLVPITLVSFVVFSLCLAALVLGPWS